MVTIRRADATELAALCRIEAQADHRFRDIGLDVVLRVGPASPGDCRAAQQAGRLLVAVEDHELLGFVRLEVVDGLAHVEQVSVGPAASGRGVGRALMGAAEAWALEHGHHRMSLCTYRDVPWNGPWYERLGWHAVPEAELGPGLRALRRHERDLGLEVVPRQAMAKDLTGATTRVASDGRGGAHNRPRGSRLRFVKPVQGGTVGQITKVLVANRGEIATRIVRAASDAGIASVAIYADSDADALFVRLADEAFALNGATPADTYLNVAKILDIAQRSGADAVHPGYGFLAENAAFAQAVIDAGLTWIGPPPEAIDSLGDKVKARHIALKVGAPLVPGTPDPVNNADEVVAFAKEHGVPVAIKAAFGGGGRGLKVARTIEEIPDLFESATREAVTAFGRGECFVERYLDKPRHVETQCLADSHGNVVVVSTRDCSLQRRHQKLVEEAPAPFLTPEQLDRLYSSSKAILKEAGYVGAGTCEFLVAQDGLISFLEVNTRLQVEHPVSEEVAGVDLVREMFRVAQGEEIGYGDPEIRGHSFEFRINAEDAGRNFMPAPGTLTRWQPPTGPGVRVDEGYHAGMTVPGTFDSLVAKVIVTGADREQALARSRRAMREMVIEGMPTVVPFHKAVLDDPAFTAADGRFGVYTNWIETEADLKIAPHTGELGEAEEGEPAQSVVVEVNGRRVEVKLPGNLSLGSSRGARATTTTKKPTKRDRGGAHVKAPSGNALTAPMQGTVVKLGVEDGATVSEGDLVVVLEAMKMENPVTAHRSGRVTGLKAEVGATVASGEVLCEIVDA